MSQLMIIIVVLLAAVAAIGLFAMFERLRYQRMVDGGAFKGIFLLKTGQRKFMMCKKGRSTPKGDEILVPVPGKESLPTYYTFPEATFDDRYPGGKGIWSRIVSVDMPSTEWYAGDPRPAIMQQKPDAEKRVNVLIDQIQGYLRDEKASEIAMMASVRNKQLEEAARNRINPNHALIAFASILITNIVIIYFTVQLQGDLNSMNNHLQDSMDAIRTLLGG